MRTARVIPEGSSRWGTVMRLAFSAAGLGTLVVLVDSVGPGSLAPLLERAAPALPLVLALELFRQGCDAAGTYLACGEARRQVPFPVMFRAQLVGHALGHLLPAGRVAGEGSKAAMVGPFVGAETAASAALTSQSMSLLAAGIVSAASFAASFHRTGLSSLTAALLVHVVAVTALGLGLRLATRSGHAGRFLARFLRRIMRREEATVPLVRGAEPLGPLAALCVGRIVSIAEVAVLALAAGVDLGLLGGFIAGGLQMIGLAAGCLVPGQLGTTEGSLVIGAAAFDATAGQALSVGLLFQTVQVALVPVGATLPMLWKARAPAA